jgi:S1-C subfamily serine protease
MQISLVDIIIVILLIGSLLRGYQIGFIRQLSSTLAFIIGLYPGSMLSSFVMTHISGPTKPLAGLAILLAVSFIFMTIAELFATRIKFSIRNNIVQQFDNGLGSIISVATLLLGIWLAGSLFQLAPASGLQTAVKNSQILSVLNRYLPPASSVLSSLNKLIDPNQSPQVFAGREPSSSANYTLPDENAYATMLASVRPSVVKLEGLGCGGLIDGSGFVYSSERIVTNAHVVAGVRSPKVTDSSGKQHNTTVVLFDANNDIAVLRVTNLDIKPLGINNTDATSGTSVFALGYPGGGGYGIQPGVILDQFTALGQDIYGQQRTERSVYSVQAKIVPGNSGGPIVDTSGQVRGVVFATSTTYDNVGYTLTAKQVAAELKQATAATAAQSTGQCSE